jgi:nicotinic acid phosphoribosyltransferase
MDLEISTRIKQRENAEEGGEADECFVDVFLDQIEQFREDEEQTKYCKGEVPKAQKYFQ